MTLRRKTVVTVISKIGDRRPRTDACLVVIYGQALGKKFSIKPGELLIGRSSQAHLQIDHESVSRRHARVHTQDDSVEISDLGSTNGTYVNDEPVEARQLKDGDLIKVGRTILKYLSSNNIEGSYHHEIYRLTTIDGLTRCYNNRHFKMQMVKEVSRAVRYTRPLSVLSFDVESFDALNEEFGHLAGDAVLAQIGKRISRRVRREETFARVGAGEFAVIVPENDREGIETLQTRMHQIIADATFGFDDVTIPVTLRSGIATLSEVDEEEAAAVFAEDETENTAHHDPFHNDTSDIQSTKETDRFVMMAEAIHGIARSRMRQED